MRIVLAGMIARHPLQGGATWAVLQWAIGLRLLGHDVVLVEQLPSAPTAEQHAYAETVHRQTGVSTLLFSGESDGELRAKCRADLLINLSGVLRDCAILASVPRRLYVDLDPGFTQVWHQQGCDVGLAGHTAHASVGLAIGAPQCLVPTLDLDWLPVPPPVVLDRWMPAAATDRWAATEVGHWRSYGSPTAAGIVYGQRAHSMRRLIDLPRRSPLPITVALGISADETTDLADLDRGGWRLVDPGVVAGSPRAYRDFVGGSAAELGVAKSGYVASRSGWFSDRSACYLAAGRPVVAQETGWSAVLPTSAGLHAYADADGAVAALEVVVGDYERARTAAHDVAREVLDARVVLGALLEKVG